MGGGECQCHGKAFPLRGISFSNIYGSTSPHFRCLRPRWQGWLAGLGINCATCFCDERECSKRGRGFAEWRGKRLLWIKEGIWVYNTTWICDSVDYNCLKPHKLAQKYSLESAKDHGARMLARIWFIYLWEESWLELCSWLWGSYPEIQHYSYVHSVTSYYLSTLEQLSEPLLFQLPSRLKDYKAPVDNTGPPAFALPEDPNQRQVTDYFTGAVA